MTTITPAIDLLAHELYHSPIWYRLERGEISEIVNVVQDITIVKLVARSLDILHAVAVLGIFLLTMRSQRIGLAKGTNSIHNICAMWRKKDQLFRL